MVVSIVFFTFFGWALGIVTVALSFRWLVVNQQIDRFTKLYDPGPQPTTVGEDPFEEAKKGIKTIEER